VKKKEKEKKKGLRISNFALLLIVLNGIMAVNGLITKSFKCWNLTQIIVRSITQHNPSWWSDGKLVRP